MALFLDEMHKGHKESRRRRYCSLRGCQPVIEEDFTGLKDDKLAYSMIVAADINGLILQSCDVIHSKWGASDADETRGIVDCERFESWVEHSYLPCLGRYLFREPRSVVILGSASIHHSDQIVELIESTGAIVLYLPPYSPDYNPIELYFREYKTSLKRTTGSRLSNVDWFTICPLCCS
uniref:Tc1-like transposase DDE domain-containing protein n=1 Tax=Leptocylindrus danicus TaxID=163516 RepID=A0A7S2P3D3_9STRA|mmetsp:Transcript_2201/g.3235  ORF Transcript_2201/g.3235 Transcript_2201/m.3235 type:complete len:179 (+) Transcript_2201:429-965(+)